MKIFHVFNSLNVYISNLVRTLSNYACSIYVQVRRVQCVCVYIFSNAELPVVRLSVYPSVKIEGGGGEGLSQNRFSNFSSFFLP